MRQTGLWRSLRLDNHLSDLIDRGAIAPALYQSATMSAAVAASITRETQKAAIPVVA
jgi:predicted transcriptional regulator